MADIVRKAVSDTQIDPCKDDRKVIPGGGNGDSGESRLQQLEEALDRYDMAVRATTDGVWDWNILTNEEYFSPRWCEILGYEFDDPELEHTYEAWASRIHPEDRQRVDEAVRAHLETGETYDVDYRHRHRSGEYRWQNSRGEAVFEDGKPVRMVGAIRDMTDVRRVHDERVELEARLLSERKEAQLALRVQQARRAESLTVLAGGIAHEFNNLLVGIIGFADLAMLDIDADSSVRPLVAQIRKSGRRAAELSAQMLAYAGRGQLSPLTQSLGVVVEENLTLLRDTCAQQSILDLELGVNVPAILGDRDQLRQVLTSLVINASEAMNGDSGRISIRTGAQHCDRGRLDAACVVAEDAIPGDYAFVEVVDEGCGIDPKTIDRIFEPFFSTKFTGRGLGLAAVRGIVISHGGAIEVASGPGSTTIRVLFPVPEVQSLAPTPDRTTSASDGGKNTVLVVDDDETVLQATRSMLLSGNYKVLTARDGVEGVAAFAEYEDEISCVVLDMVMPRMDGAEAYAELRRIRTDVPVVLSTGYAAQDLMGKIGQIQFASILMKPYGSDKLLDSVQAAMQAVVRT